MSTEDQNCEMQLRELRAYCTGRNWTIFREYVDTDWGGNRPELDQLMKDAARHCFDVVLVWKLGRFGRSVLHSAQQLGALSSYGMPFIATSQGLDTGQANPSSRMLLLIMTAVADFERERIRERVKAGLHAAQQKGVKLGRPLRIFDRDKARRLHKQGMSLRDIAERLNVPRSTVHRLLKRLRATPEARPKARRGPAQHGTRSSSRIQNG